jgi:hypothetical protein
MRSSSEAEVRGAPRLWFAALIGNAAPLSGHGRLLRAE